MNFINPVQANLLNSNSPDPGDEFWKTFLSAKEIQRVLLRQQLISSPVERLMKFRWQVFFRGSFSHEVGDEFARRSGVEFVYHLGPNAYGAIFWGQGLIGGRFHVHALLGGLWKGTLSDLQIALNYKLLARRWEHQHGSSHVELFNPRRGGISYLAGHHSRVTACTAAGPQRKFGMT